MAAAGAITAQIPAGQMHCRHRQMHSSKLFHLSFHSFPHHGLNQVCEGEYMV
jgi:hypothetical protein